MSFINPSWGQLILVNIGFIAVIALLSLAVLFSVYSLSENENTRVWNMKTKRTECKSGAPWVISTIVFMILVFIVKLAGVLFNAYSAYLAIDRGMSNFGDFLLIIAYVLFIVIVGFFTVKVTMKS